MAIQRGGESLFFSHSKALQFTKVGMKDEFVLLCIKINNESSYIILQKGHF